MTRRALKSAVGAALTCALVGVGCGGADTSDGASEEKTEVVAAFYPVAAAAARVGGSCAAVKNLTPAGAEPHDLELSPDQVDAIQDARIVFVMGRGFQPAVEKSASQRDGATVELLDELPAHTQEGGLDPHVWLDPPLYSRLVGIVASELSKADASCRTQIGRNATRYQREIERVGAEYESGLRDCRRRTIVTSHDAFGYLAEQYGLAQEGIAGISPDEEPSAQRIADIADLVRTKGITTVFTEELVSRRVAEALAREAGGVRIETLNPLEGLTEREVARGDDWASVMRRNLAKLRAALGCREAAPQG